MLVLFCALNFLTLGSDPNPETQQWKDMQFLLDLVPGSSTFLLCHI